MRRLTPAAIVLAGLCAGVFAPSGVHHAAAGIPGATGVTIARFSYDPDPITVSAGATIIWSNTDPQMHSVTADDGSFDTDLFGQGESKTLTFDEPGVFAYGCTIHPNMHGTVIVQ